MLSYTSSKLTDLIKIKNDNDNKILKNKYENIFKVAADFIKENNLVLYGGTALNYMVNSEDKFYDENSLPDFDVFGVNAKELSKKMADKFLEKGFKFIEAKDAIHSGTYKVSVKFMPIIDITDVSKEFYQFLIKYGTISHDNFSLCPASLIKWSMHFEMASPDTSIYRWLKIYSRMNLLNKGKQKIEYDDYNNNQKNNDLNDVLQYIKDNNFIIVGTYAMELHGYKGNIKTKTLSIMTDDINKIKFMKKKANSMSFEMMFQKYLISKEGNVFLRAYVVGKDRCMSYIEKNGYYIGTVDAVMALLYSEYIYNLVKNRYADDILDYINKYNNFVSKMDENSGRFSLTCIGSTKTLLEKMEENWVKNIRTFVYRPV